MKRNRRRVQQFCSNYRVIRDIERFLPNEVHND